MFAVACVQAIRRPAPLFLMYSVPPLLMVGLHAAVANHYPRYNLGLIGPIAVGSAWFMVTAASAMVSRRRKARRA
jgi:hypothetical protein